MLETHEEIVGIIQAWDVGPILTTALPDTGTVNQTVLLTTNRGRFVVRGYRHRDRAPVVREPAIIAHVCAHGIPAVAPIALPGAGGDTILERDGRFYALFPWAAGRQVDRTDIGAQEAAAMGACLGRLHHALSRFPPDQVPRRLFAPDRQATLAQMDRLEATIRAGAHADPLAAVVLARLAGQRVYLQQLPESATIELAPLDEQVIHGDYQESNLFFARGQVSAIIDWDQTHIAPRAWEVMRTFDLALGFRPALCHRFLQAYRRDWSLPLEDLDVAAAAYDVRTRHGLWVYEAYYLEGNQRVAPFLQAGAIAPVAERWARVREACAPGAPEPDS